MVILNLGLGTVRLKQYGLCSVSVCNQYTGFPQAHEQRFAPALGAQGSRLSPANKARDGTDYPRLYYNVSSIFSFRKAFSWLSVLLYACMT